MKQEEGGATKRYGYLGTLLLAVVLLVGCLSSPSIRIDTGIEGYVYIPTRLVNQALSEDVEILFSAQSTPPPYYSAVEGATVRVRNNRTGETERRTTDRDGYFAFRNLTEGTYTLTVSEGALWFEAKEQIPVRRGQMTLFGEDGIPPFRDTTIFYIVIGIDDYADLDEPIPGVVNNARRVYNTLFGTNHLGGLGQLLINEEATKSGIGAAIDWVLDIAIPDDNLVIYFAGRSGQDYLSPSDDRVDAGWDRAIKDVELENRLKGFPGGVTLIIDGSESSTMADGNYFPLALREPKYTVISAAHKDENIFWEPELGSSVFTHFLIEGITRPYPADRNEDGKITASELFDYIDYEMGVYFGGDPERHYPDFWPGSRGESVIFRY